MSYSKWGLSEDTMRNFVNPVEVPTDTIILNPLTPSFTTNNSHCKPILLMIYSYVPVRKNFVHKKEPLKTWSGLQWKSLKTEVATQLGDLVAGSDNDRMHGTKTK